MKKLILLAVVFNTQILWAMSYQASCIGNRGQVAISLYTTGDKLIMRYNNAMGAQDFPFYEGVVTKTSMSFINMAEKELASIDDEAIVSWPVENCKFSKETPLLMNCNGEATFIAPADSKLKSYTFSTSMIKEDGLDSHFEIFKIRWGIEGEYLHHSIAMPFDPKFCQAKFLP